MQETLLGTAGLLIAGAISPGPNNFIVVRAAARSGWRGALAAIVGIVAGGLALLALACAGVGAALAAEPRFAAAVAAAGSLYLIGLGARLAAAAGAEESPGGAAGPSALPSDTWGLVAFQFLNPKAWLLVMTVTASAQASLGLLRAVPALAALFILVPAACLGLWSWAGVVLERRLRGPARRRFDRVLGAFLIASALLLIIDVWR